MELSGRPLFDNPLDAALFVHRAEVDRVERNIEDGVNTLIFGEPGSGKTSLLRYLLFRLRDSESSAVMVDAALVESALDLLRLLGVALGQPRELTARIDIHRAAGLGDLGSILGEIEALRSMAGEGERTTVLIDLPPSAKAHELFGRYRDELWRLPFTWIVAAPDRLRVQLMTPPADAFFDDVFELGPLSPEQQEDLIGLRLDEGTRTPWRIANDGEGNPRRLLEIVRESLRTETDPDRQLEALAGRERAVAALGRAASMLYAELQGRGPASASDEDLLDRLGWSRQRAATVFGQLEDAGFLRADFEPGPKGRPRKVFVINPPLPK